MGPSDAIKSSTDRRPICAECPPGNASTACKAAEPSNNAVENMYIMGWTRCVVLFKAMLADEDNGSMTGLYTL